MTTKRRSTSSNDLGGLVNFSDGRSRTSNFTPFSKVFSLLASGFVVETEQSRLPLQRPILAAVLQEDNDNAPRFTLAELREVLQEKNLLKGKVLELEEELEQLRPARRPGSAGSDVNQELEQK